MNAQYFDRMLNMDITNKCRLQCPSCDRQIDRSMVERARDITLEDYEKIIETFRAVEFCGQIGDPIYHPQFIELLEMSHGLDRFEVSTNGSGKKMEWWKEVFKRCPPKTVWRFALDGLPNESHIYRINQDGEAVWKVMRLGASMGCNIVWQYIPFRYNENHIDEASKMAADAGIDFLLKISNRHPVGLEPLDPNLRMDYVEA